MVADSLDGRQRWWLATVIFLALPPQWALGDLPVRFTQTERTMILSHGPWPTADQPDSSNRFSGEEGAIAFGRELFSDPRLSLDERMSCATCHQTQQAMTDGLALAMGRRQLDRNTPPIANLQSRRWYGWDGRSDSLWAQSIHPVLNDDELAMTSMTLARKFARTPELADRYQQVTGRPVSQEDAQTVLVNVSKILAAWQETLKTPTTDFDRFRDAMAAGKDLPESLFSRSARRGLKLFVGDGRCSLCHFGPRFTNDEFHHVGLPHFTWQEKVDPGRHGGIETYRSNPYSRFGEFSDQPAESAARSAGIFLVLSHEDWGRFRVPSLRNVSATAPYMHDGSLPDLPAVIRHYSEMDRDRLHSAGESLLRPLNLTQGEASDLEAFLRTLSGDPEPLLP